VNEDINIWALVPAAGHGARMQAAVPKQYLPLLGRPVILHTLERLCNHPRVAGVLVGLASDDPHFRTVPVSHLQRFFGTFPGGSTRAETVLNGLGALSRHARDTDWVMVHDAVRPCVRHDDIDRLIRVAISSKDGALLAIPVADTLKRADASRCVESTIARDSLWRAQTPQMFRFDRLISALTKSLKHGYAITDEASAIERDGGRPCLVEGREDNIKVTLPADLALAEAFLRAQSGDIA
jgi:2-C-methyl-D-erythritol 4-phosphate cytidylyltransferase